MTAPVDPTGDFGENDVDEIAYNFDKWIEPKRGRVVVPEPSTEAVIAFYTDWQASFTHAQIEIREASKKFEDLPEDAPREDREDRLIAQDAAAQEVAAKMSVQRIALIADVCQQTPSVEELTKLPHRVRRAFEAYLIGKLGPEA